MAPIRVHALIDSLTWGGAESLLADLASGAADAGIALTVGYLQEVDGSPNAQRLRARGIEPQLVGIERLLDPCGPRRVRRQLIAARPEIVHTHLGASDVHGAIAARSLGIPAVSTVHLMAARRTGDARADAKERMMARARRHGSSRVITVSEAARGAYLDARWDRPEHVVTVHNGIAEPSRTVPPAQVRDRLGIADDELVVTMVSVLRAGKGHDVLAATAAQVLPRFPRLRVLIVGDGPDRARVEAQFAPLGETALLLGHRDDVPDLLAASDVLVHPTRVDAFPTVLLEAAAAGLPVIATAVGGVPEIVDDGISGLLVAPPPAPEGFAQPLEALLADGAWRAALGRAARIRFEHRFTAVRWALRLRAAYERELSGRPQLTDGAPVAPALR